MARSYALFDTALGRCGIAWSENGLVALQLPEANEEQSRRNLISRTQAEAAAKLPVWVRRAVRQVSSHLRGKPQDFSALPLDLSHLPEFHRRVYSGLRQIAAGDTRSYGELAALVGSPKAARAVGQAVARNPLPVVIPCHRVLAHGNRPGGFSAYGGLATKAKLLQLEGAGWTRVNAPSLFRTRGRFGFDLEEAVRRLSQMDPKLGRLMERVGPFTLNPRGRGSPLESLAQSIVHQQLAGSAARRIFDRLLALFPAGMSPELLLALPVESLRQAGLSGSKAAALRDLAQKTVDGVVPTREQMQRLDEETLIQRLTTVRGIGRWTVEMMLIFYLGRPDVLPADDYGVRKGFALAFRKKALPTPKELMAYGDRWRPFRTIASWYLWRALEL